MPTTQIYFEMRGLIKPKKRFTVHCLEHGDLLKTWSEPESIAFALLHEAGNHSEE